MTLKEHYTVAIIDDHPLFRRGVHELLDLEPAVEVVGEAGTREEALDLVRRYEPDLTILDLNMKGSSGVEILSTLKEEDPSRRIVILTVSDSGKDLTACIQAGADGYFLKDMEPEQFLKSIRQALEGQIIVDASMMAFLTTSLRAKMRSVVQERPVLTGREGDVLELIAKGCTNKVIARRLDITEGTVKGHVKHILKKLGCRSRVEAAVWAAQQKEAE
ncbi:MAG: two-component system response regulator NarL [Sutterella wadsworthensis]|nr:two-component system response regulator NarL [Sutterella wadsworthensis]